MQIGLSLGEEPCTKHEASFPMCATKQHGSEDHQSMEADGACDGVDEFLGVVSDAVFEDEVDVFDLGDFGAGIAFDDHNVSALTGFERTDALGFAEILRAIQSLDADGFERSETGFDEKLDVALITEPC